MELLQKLGIDWRLLIAQLVNFLILLFVLYKFLYKPVLNLLDSRKEKIEKGLKDAEKLGEELERTKELKDREIQKAKKEAMEIIEEARKTAESAGQEIKAKAKIEVEKIIVAAKNQIVEDREKMAADIKKETVMLVMAVTEKVLGKSVDAKIEQSIIEKTLKDAKK